MTDFLKQQVPQSLIDKARGIMSPEELIKLKQKESAALAMCGGLLGNCYLLAEVTENMIVEALAKFKTQKWYRQKIKYAFNKAHNDLHTTIAGSINNSPTNPEYMREVADSIYNMLKGDLYKLHNAVNLEIGKRRLPYAEECADMVTIDIMLRYINKEYDDIMGYMSTIMDAFYDSWYHPARCEGPSYWWNRGMQEFAKAHVSNTLDLNGIQTIQTGIDIIQTKMHSNEIASAARSEASQYADDGGGQEMFKQALDILNLK